MSDAVYSGPIPDIVSLLNSKWVGVPILIWVGVLLISLIIVLRCRSFRLKFKGRDRELLLEAGPGAKRDENK